MTRAPGLPLFVAFSLLLHGMLALVWQAPDVALRHPGSALQISLLPPHAREVHQSEAGASAGTTRVEPRTTITTPLRSPQAALHTPVSVDAKSSAPGETKGAAAQHMAAQVAARAEGSGLRRRITRALAQYFYYPPVAIRFGWQGTVRIGLRVNQRGTISHVHLVHSSGYAVLDAAALRSTQRIRSLGDLGPASRVQHFDLQVPVVYRLAEG